MNWTFNLSYSTYDTFLKSPIQFYFDKILNCESDTDSYKVYGHLGNIIHSICEDYVKRGFPVVYDYEVLFNKLWNDYKIDNLKTINNHNINKTAWLDYIKISLDFTNDYIKQYNNIEVEKYLEFTYDDGLLVKGFVDVFVKDNNGNILLFDYKTNTDNDYEMHRNQRLFYSWLCYKVLGVIPKKCVWFYCKKYNLREDSFSYEDIIKFNEEIESWKKDIIKNKDDINWFELKKWDNIFNNHRKKCFKEYLRRNNKKVIKVNIKNNSLFFEGLDDNLKSLFNKKFSYLVENHRFSDLFKKKLWDGRKVLFKKDSLPVGLKCSVVELINDYNKYFNTNYVLEFVEDDKLVKSFNTKFTPSKKVLRDYQVDSVNKILSKKIGIISLATGLGKTVAAAEIIRRVNNRVLFVINNIKLVNQTVDVFEKELGVSIGKMSEGNLSINNQITVCSVQTIHSLVKKKDKVLIKYLYNVNTLIYDECHNCSDTGYYNSLNKYLYNCVYRIGLTATPYRNDGSTLEMNGVVGVPIVNYDTEYGESNGYLCPTKIKFIRHNTGSSNDDYHDRYKELIVNNKSRNEVIKKLCDYHKDKKIIVLTKSVDHASVLSELIEGSKIINSSVSNSSREDVFNEFLENEGIRVIICGIKIMGTGVDIPFLEVIINASSHQSENDTIQSIGRLKRKFEGKDYGVYYDFADNGSFSKATKERLNTLRKNNYSFEILNLDEVFI